MMKTSLTGMLSATLRIAAPLCTALLTISTAFAEGSEHHGSIADLKWFWVNFVLYTVLLSILLQKPLRNGWAARRERIAQAVTSATDDVAKAERELAAVESLIKNSAVDQSRVHSEIVKQGELEAAEILKAASEKSSRLTSQVKDLLEGESRSAQIAFRAELVKRAVNLSKGRFESGEFASRQSMYVDAAISRAKRLV